MKLRLKRAHKGLEVAREPDCSGLGSEESGVPGMLASLTYSGVRRAWIACLPSWFPDVDQDSVQYSCLTGGGRNGGNVR